MHGLWCKATNPTNDAIVSDDKPKLVELVEHTDDSAHWSPEACLRHALGQLERLGGRTLMCSFIDREGKIQVYRAGRDAELTILAAKLGAYELRLFDFDPEP